MGMPLTFVATSVSFPLGNVWRGSAFRAPGRSTRRCLNGLFWSVVIAVSFRFVPLADGLDVGPGAFVQRHGLPEGVFDAWSGILRFGFLEEFSRCRVDAPDGVFVKLENQRSRAHALRMRRMIFFFKRRRRRKRNGSRYLR